MSNRCDGKEVFSEQSLECCTACLSSQLDEAILPFRQLRVVPEGVHLLREWAAWLS